MVHWTSLAPFLAREHTRAQAGYVARAARMRYGMVFLATTAVLGASIMIPRLAPWMG